MYAYVHCQHQLCQTEEPLDFTWARKQVRKLNSFSLLALYNLGKEKFLEFVSAQVSMQTFAVCFGA